VKNVEGHRDARRSHIRAGPVSELPQKGDPMAKIQRQYKTGAEYRVEGVSKSVRRLRFIGKARINGKEILMFRPVRVAGKRSAK
jgi:hypothetical protein